MQWTDHYAPNAGRPRVHALPLCLTGPTYAPIVRLAVAGSVQQTHVGTRSERVATQVRFGLLPSPQYTSWDEMRRVGLRADALGYYSLWCSDHLQAPYPWVVGPAFEAYTILAAWAALTSRVRLGAMVGAVGFRNPAVAVKMATTLDHISGGRAYLSVGAGWFEAEHDAFGIPFGSPGERVGRLREALEIMRTMLDGKAAEGREYYAHRGVRNLPPPVQPSLPILVGGKGDKMLGLVARYADAWNIAGTLDAVQERLERLRERCSEIGRSPDSIELTYHGGPVFIRDSFEAAQAVKQRAFDAHGIDAVDVPLVGPPDYVAERLAPFVKIGFTHLYFDSLSPYDDESLDRLIGEVHPMLAGQVA